jgi:ubiquinone/menaquinone biosynthesis C-methylase UbiE
MAGRSSIDVFPRREPVSEWCSYDGIAGRYDSVWGSRFEAAARFVRRRLPSTRRARVLDIGTGTGIALSALCHQGSKTSRPVGLDRSFGMIRMARVRVPGATFAAGDAAMLPFREGVFDAASASFVVSHLSDYRAGLLEARRVLRPGGVFAMTSWGAEGDSYGDAWRELLARAIAADRLQAAANRAVPNEVRFESAANVGEALSEAGFMDVEVHSHDLHDAVSVEDFLIDRELSSTGRFARQALGVDGWAQFTTHAREALGRRFGSTLERSRGILLGLARRA